MDGHSQATEGAGTMTVGKIYRSGERTGAKGLYECADCGAELPLKYGEAVPPCKACGKSVAKWKFAKLER